MTLLNLKLDNMDIKTLNTILKDFNYWQKAMEYADVNYKMKEGDSLDKYNKGIEVKEAYEAGYKLALKIVSSVIANDSMIDDIHAANPKPTDTI